MLELEFEERKEARVDTLRGCIGLGLLLTFIEFFKMMTFIEFDRFLNTLIDFCRVYKFINDFHRLLF